MSFLERAANRLSDIDLLWWPFLSLRPPRDQLMDARCVLRLTLVYGPLTALLTAALIWADGERDVRVILAFSLPAIPLFFVLYTCTSAHWWNRRARRLREVAGEPAAAAI